MRCSSWSFALTRRRASEQTPIKWERWKRFGEQDLGMQISRRMRQIVFDHAQPAAVVCNGKFATWDVKDQQFDSKHLRRKLVSWAGADHPQIEMYVGEYVPQSGNPFPVLGTSQSRYTPAANRGTRRDAIVDLSQRPANEHRYQIQEAPMPWDGSRDVVILLEASSSLLPFSDSVAISLFCRGALVYLAIQNRD